MKKTSNFILLFLVSLVYMTGLSSVYAEEYLDDYSKVKRQVPQYIIQKIMVNAEKRYPDNDRLKQYTVEIQKKAYFKVKDYKNDGLPSQELNLIMKNAERNNPYDYGSQLLVVTKKVKEYIDSHK